MDKKSSLPNKPNGKKIEKQHILIVFDTWGNVNGINTIYLTLFEKFKSQSNLKITVIHPSYEEKIVNLYSNIFIYHHRPHFIFKTPFYKEIVQGFPKKKSFATIEDKIGKVNIIHFPTQGLFGLYFARLAKKRNIASTGFYHTFMPMFIEYYYPPIINKLFVSLYKKIDQYVYNHCQAIIAHTKETKDYLNQYLKVKKYYFTTSFLTNEDKQNKKTINTKKNIKIGYIGRITKEKNILPLLKIKKELKEKNVNLIFIGDGPLKNKIYREAKDYFSFTGYLKKQQLWNQVKKLDFIIIPSLTDTLNMTLIENAYYGIPAIVINNTVPSGIVKKYNSGIIIDNLKEKKWIDSVVDIFSSKKYQQLSQNSLKLGKENHIDNAVKLFLSAWKVK